MSRFSSRRKACLALGVSVAVVAMAATAFAYWTRSGEGSSTVKSNYAIAWLEVSSSPAATVSLGARAQITVKVRDSDANQDVYLTKLEAEVTETSVAGCKKEWFEVTPASQEPQVAITHGETKEYTESVRMKEEASIDQSACKDATVTLHYRAS